MKSRRVKNWIWWLLPLMAARAILPVGFMLGAGEHGFGMMLCGVSMPVAQEHAHHHHDGAGDENESTPKHSGGLTCPFAHAALGSPTSFDPLPGAIFARSASIILSDPQRFVSFGPPRLDRVRGPPALS